MMKNKVIIKAIFPTIDKEYDVKVPVNEVIWKINKLVVKSVYDLNSLKYDMVSDKFVMINKLSGVLYDNNSVLIDTDIRNGSEIIFLRAQ